MVSMTSSDGSTVVTCKSLHLTSFAVLVNAGDGLSDVRAKLIHTQLEYLIIHMCFMLNVTSKVGRKTEGSCKQ